MIAYCNIAVYIILYIYTYILYTRLLRATSNKKELAKYSAFNKNEFAQRESGRGFR